MKKNGFFILKKVYLNFPHSVLKVINTIEEVITKLVKTIQGLILIDICLTKENNTQITDSIQNYYCIWVFNVTNNFEKYKHS